MPTFYACNWINNPNNVAVGDVCYNMSNANLHFTPLQMYAMLHRLACILYYEILCMNTNLCL